MDKYRQDAELFLGGLTRGSIYALIALGYTMVYGIIQLINFAHGEIFAAGGYIGVIVLSFMQARGVLDTHPFLGLLLAFVLAMIYCAFLAVALETVAYRPLRGASRLALLLSALGMSIFLSNGMMLSQGVSDRAYPPIFGMDGVALFDQLLLGSAQGCKPVVAVLQLDIAEFAVEQLEEWLQAVLVPRELELRPAQLVQGLLVETGFVTVFDDLPVSQLGIVVTLAEKQHFAAAELDLVDQGRRGILGHEFVQHLQCVIRAPADLVRPRELVQHRVIAAVAGIRLQQALVKTDGIVVAGLLEAVDVFGQLCRFARLEFQVAQTTHGLGAERRIVRDEVENFVRRRAGRQRFGLVLLAPPGEEQPAGPLVSQAGRLLDAEGEMLVVSRDKGFEPNRESLRGLSTQEITDETTARDFASRPHLRVWRIRLSDAR